MSRLHSYVAVKLKTMPVVISYDPALDEKVSFGYSAACEVCWALDCLTNPEHHAPQSSWIVQTRERIPQGLHTRVVQIEPGDWATAVALFEPAGFAPFELEVAQARALSDKQVREALESSCLDRPPEFLRSVDDLTAWRDYLCDLLDAFWPYFESTWQRLQQSFIAEVIRLEGLHRQGRTLPELLSELTPQIIWDPDSDEIRLATFSEARLAGKELAAFVVQPSYFCIPRVQARLGRVFAAWIPYPGALELDEPPSVDGLIAPLKAIAQDVRLKMLGLMLNAPRSTRELASILHTSPPAISRHLKQLVRAGLVRQVGRSERGMYVRYEVEAEAVRKLGEELTLFLEYR